MIEIKKFLKKNALKINGGKTGNSREKKSKTVRILKKKNDERRFFFLTLNFQRITSTVISMRCQVIVKYHLKLDNRIESVHPLKK